MHPQLEAIEREFEEAQARLHRLAASTDEPLFTRRPPNGGWSAAECVAHLNLSGQASLPVLDEGLVDARERGGPPRERMRRDLIGWMLWKSLQPNGRVKVKTGNPFVPAEGQTKTEVIAEFDRLQEEQLERLRAADGLPIDQIKVRSPFVNGIRYSLFSTFTVLSIHQHRHLAQAERAVAAARESSVASDAPRPA